jgi:outer membrane protein TolC
MRTLISVAMTQIRNARLLTAVVVVLTLAAVPSAQVPAAQQPGGSLAITMTPPPAPAPQGPSTGAQAPQIDRYVVGQAKPQETPGSPMVELTLEKAILIALENNLELQSQRINPILQDISLRSLRATYLPTFSSSFGHSNSKRPNNNTLLDNLPTITTLNQSYSVGMNQNMRWYGGNMRLSFSSGRNATNQSNQANNPSLSGGVSVNYTQPLFANFKIDSNRNNVRVSAVTRQITDITLLNQIENTRASVRTAYWGLRRSIEQIEIARRALELAKRQLSETMQKVEIGTVAPIDATNFDVQVANSEGQLLAAQIAWTTQELAFKRLLVNGASDPLYTSTINPVDQPLLMQTPVDIQAAVANALAQRTDLETTRKNLQVSSMNLELSRNATLPQLSLTGGYSMAGQGGPTVQQGVPVPGGYFDALSSMFDRPSWNVGLSYSYPLGQVSVKTALARAELQMEQQKVSLKSQELNVTAEVTQAGMNVTNAYRSYEAAKKSADAQQRNAEAAQTRFSAGLATPFEVAQALQSLTTQRLSELNAIINYLNAVADFDKRQRVGG